MLLAVWIQLSLLVSLVLGSSSMYCSTIAPSTFEITTCATSNFCSNVQNTRTLPDRNALRQLYQTTNGPSWTQSENWMLEDVSHCDWAGVCCDPDSCHVTSLSLPNNNLTGFLPYVFSDLPELSVLSLPCNDGLSFALHAITDQTSSKLAHVRLDGCFLLDNLPDFLPSAFPHLTTLKLNDNYISGSVPDSLLRLPAIQEIDLSHNSLQGSIPTLHSDTLHTLRLNNNQISGEILADLFKHSLSVLDLSFNNFNSTLPNTLDQSTGTITLFRCNSCKLQGSIPSQFISALPNLRHLFLSYNNLEGSIPAELFQLPSLTIAQLDHNQLTGTLPDSLVQSPSLAVLDLFSNQLHGSLSIHARINHVDIRHNPLMRWNPSTDSNFWQQVGSLVYYNDYNRLICSARADRDMSVKLLADGSYSYGAFCTESEEGATNLLRLSVMVNVVLGGLVFIMCLFAVYVRVRS